MVFLSTPSFVERVVLVASWFSARHPQIRATVGPWSLISDKKIGIEPSFSSLACTAV
jgi:hypothetical protein